MRQAAHVVQIESVAVAGVVDVCDVILGELRRTAEVIRSIFVSKAVRQPRGQTSVAGRNFEREIKFGCSQFHVVVPHIFGIAVKRNDSQQAIWTRAGARVWRGVWIGQIGERKNVFSVLEALIRKRPVAVMVKLIAQCKISSQPPCQIRTDQRPRRPSYINRPVANKEGGVDTARLGGSRFPGG